MPQGGLPLAALSAEAVRHTLAILASRPLGWPAPSNFLQLTLLPGQPDLLPLSRELLAICLFLVLRRTVSQYNKRTLRD